MSVLSLDEKRESMIEFLAGNIKGKNINREGNDVSYEAKNGTRFFIKTLSRQMEFPFDFVEEPNNFDEDRRRLRTLCSAVAEFIRGKNQQGYVPGFVFLAADTDYSQLRNRTTSIVNHGHFTKQELPSHDSPKPHTDQKYLDPLELVVQQFYRFNNLNGNKKRHAMRDVYVPEQTRFNPKTGIIEVVYFSDVKPSELGKMECCPACRKQNGEGISHMQCKETPDYIRYRAARYQERYQRDIMIALRRVPIDGKHQQVEKGISFVPAEVYSAKLQVPYPLKIAVVKR